MGSAEMRRCLAVMAAVGVCAGLVPVPAGAAAAEPFVLGQQAPEAALPPLDSPTLFNTVELRFPTQGPQPRGKHAEAV